MLSKYPKEKFGSREHLDFVTLTLLLEFRNTLSLKLTRTEREVVVAVNELIIPLSFEEYHYQGRENNLMHPIFYSKESELQIFIVTISNNMLKVR
ncbi:unnamed protein product [Ceratitis capitata]|uniref:(Mediterranean fruit fly) hypothetical protein n=1 Tax=Ceratitis capitata TaxID=7213 RepID=A0A811U7X1_CERCA|nr:unnamed protein product [Ceratitis capitata]